MRTKTTFTVTTAADVVDAGDGKLSLREAVAQAIATTAADRVVFASGLEGTSLTLAHGELSVAHNLTVDGDANNDSVRVTIDGNDIGRIFNIAGSNTGVTLRDLALTGGYADDNHGTVYEGGAIFLGGGSLEVSAVDLLAASAAGQTGASRPLSAGSLPDIGSVEIGQPLSTSPSVNNDVITDGRAGHTIKALAGADYVKGRDGADSLYGGDGGDLLDGRRGNDRLYGDARIDLDFYGGSSKVTVDLSLATNKAFRGSDTDTLYKVEGAIGSSAADTFKGDSGANWFQGGLGKDTCTGSGGRDLYDFNSVSDSPTGSTTRDLIKDFAAGTDKLDLTGIDADGTLAANQAAGLGPTRWPARARSGCSPRAATPSSRPAPTPTRRSSSRSSSPASRR